MKEQATPRNRLIYFALVILVIGLGLGSRTAIIPAWIYPYLGDVLYATMTYFIMGFLFPRFEVFKIALISIGICFAIEVSQMLDWEFLNTIRNNRIGRLILGRGFLWSDLVSYAIGGGLGVLLEWNRWGLNKSDR